MAASSKAGSAASIIAFGVGIVLGLNLGLPWPVSWAAALTLGIVWAVVTSAVAETIHLRKRYPVNTFGVHITRDAEAGHTVEDCYSCSGADHDGYRVEWSKDRVFGGLVRERLGGGISHYCRVCEADAIDAGLRATNQRQFRERYQGEAFWFEVLTDLRDAYIQWGFEVDFWRMVEVAMDRVEVTDDTDDPREYVEAVGAWQSTQSNSEFWTRLAEIRGKPEDELQERLIARDWFWPIRHDPFAPVDDDESEQEAAAATDRYGGRGRGY